MTQFNFGVRIALLSYADQGEADQRIYMPLTSKYAYAMFVSDIVTGWVCRETFCLRKGVRALRRK